jgi:hypothetical protein
MSYVVLYFSIGVFLAILVYLYSCYDYRVNFKDIESWERYSDSNEVPQLVFAFCIAYPLLLIILAFVGLGLCIEYTAEYVREWIFKMIDQHFVK